MSRRKPPAPSNPPLGEAPRNGSYKCRFCKGLIVISPATGLEVGHTEDCHLYPY